MSWLLRIIQTAHWQLIALFFYFFPNHDRHMTANCLSLCDERHAPVLLHWLNAPWECLVNLIIKLRYNIKHGTWTEPQKSCFYSSDKEMHHNEVTADMNPDLSAASLTSFCGWLLQNLTQPLNSPLECSCDFTAFVCAFKIVAGGFRQWSKKRQDGHLDKVHIKSHLCQGRVVCNHLSSPHPAVDRHSVLTLHQTRKSTHLNFTSLRDESDF